MRREETIPGGDKLHFHYTTVKGNTSPYLNSGKCVNPQNQSPSCCPYSSFILHSTSQCGVSALWVSCSWAELFIFTDAAVYEGTCIL